MALHVNPDWYAYSWGFDDLDAPIHITMDMYVYIYSLTPQSYPTGASTQN